MKKTKKTPRVRPNSKAFHIITITNSEYGYPTDYSLESRFVHVLSVVKVNVLGVIKDYAMVQYESERPYVCRVEELKPVKNP